ncbi:MAG: [FeFe] hydrogenase H-cluster radical SAM maturase HydE [Terrisporobacter sp.]
MNNKELIDKLYKYNSLNKAELLYLLNTINNEDKNYLCEKALKTRTKYYGDKVYVRGLIEFTNFCKNNCYYCGIRCSNKNIERYRLILDKILECAEIGYELGYKTFVLQGGEDPYFTDEKIVEIIKILKEKYSDCAITLSIGEKSYDSYKKFFQAGADRYLLRHETATKEHYEKLHPENLKLINRMECLKNLKEIGYQVGAGFMVESPYQSNENLVEDLLYLKELEPHMIGIGPFIPHHDTIFKNEPTGTLEKTIIMIALTRLLLPKSLIPATTALSTINSNGREAGFNAGANVVMPNLSPTSVRSKYSLYDNKISLADEAAECRDLIEKKIIAAGFSLDTSRGDNIAWNR